MDSGPSKIDPAELDAAFRALEAKSPVAFEIYRRRQLAAGNRPTLQELGDELCVTRERVRQLESQFGVILRRSLADPSHPIRRASALLEERLGELSQVEQLVPVLDEIGGAKGGLQPHHRVQILLDLAGPYDMDEQWCARPSVFPEARALLARVLSEGPVPLADATRKLARLGFSQKDAETWLRAEQEYAVIDNHVAPRGRTLADRGVSVLIVRGMPMTLEEIFATLDEKRSLRSFKNQMQGDERVMRRGLKHYGLAAWGGEEYTTVTDEMEQEIERRGGSAMLDELAEFLSERFGISPSSVRMYSTGAQFVVSDDGLITVPSILEVPETKPLALTRRCFKFGSSWSFRRTVDHDVLRGSGSAIPLGFAKELGLVPTGTLRLDTPYGPLSCSWPSHMAHVGSLRRAAESQGAREGDHLFVVALGENRADIIHVAASDWSALSGIEQLSRHCGCDGKTVEDVAASLDLDPAVSGSIATRVRQQLLHRGEDELARLVGDEDDLLETLAGI